MRQPEFALGAGTKFDMTTKAWLEGHEFDLEGQPEQLCACGAWRRCRGCSGTSRRLLSVFVLGLIRNCLLTRPRVPRTRAIPASRQPAHRVTQHAVIV